MEKNAAIEPGVTPPERREKSASAPAAGRPGGDDRPERERLADGPAKRLADRVEGRSGKG
jgi:hypothetical protein